MSSTALLTLSYRSLPAATPCKDLMKVWSNLQGEAQSMIFLFVKGTSIRCTPSQC